VSEPSARAVREPSESRQRAVREPSESRQRAVREPSERGPALSRTCSLNSLIFCSRGAASAWSSRSWLDSTLRIRSSSFFWSRVCLAFVFHSYLGWVGRWVGRLRNILEVEFVRHSYVFFCSCSIFSRRPAPSFCSCPTTPAWFLFFVCEERSSSISRRAPAAPLRPKYSRSVYRKALVAKHCSRQIIVVEWVTG
jgi:hypothetical protein